MEMKMRVSLCYHVSLCYYGVIIIPLTEMLCAVPSVGS